MGSIKIHEIAKKLGLTSKEVLKKAQELGMEVKSHLSGITESDADKLEGAFKSNSEKTEQKVKKEDKEPGKKDEKKKDKNAGPVIIRREVIISDEELKKQEEKEKAKKPKLQKM